MQLELTTIESFITGLGIGSIITAYIQYKLSRRAKKADNLFDERKLAFDSLLVAYASLAEGWSDSKAKQFALCEARIQLVASNTTIAALVNLKASEANTSQREEAHEKLIEAMRHDLGLV